MLDRRSVWCASVRLSGGFLQLGFGGVVAELQGLLRLRYLSGQVRQLLLLCQWPELRLVEPAAEPVPVFRLVEQVVVPERVRALLLAPVLVPGLHFVLLQGRGLERLRWLQPVLRLE